MRQFNPTRAARLSLYAASTVACVAIATSGCRADPLDTGPAQAQVDRAVVYPTDPAVSTRSGASVPAGGVVTTDAAALSPATRPADAASTQPADDRVIFAAPTSRPSYSYTSDGAQQGTYDNGNPPNADYTGTYDRGVASYGYANGNAGYASNQYDGYPNDYWYDRGYWAASPYFYDNYVTSGYGVGYPYNYYGGRTYVYRNYDNRGDRYDGRRYNSDWNDRAKYRERNDRSPRVPYPYTDRDRDGNGVDDARDNGANRPSQTTRDRPDHRNDDPRATDARNEQARVAGEQRRDANERREQSQSDTTARRTENRAAAEQTQSRSEPAARPAPAADPARAADAPRSAEAPRNDAPRQAAPAAPAPARSSAAPSGGASRGGGGGAPAPAAGRGR